MNHTLEMATCFQWLLRRVSLDWGANFCISEVWEDEGHFFLPFPAVTYYHGHVCFKKREAQNYIMIIPWYLFYSFTQSNPMWTGKWGISYGSPAVFWICATILCTRRYKEAIDCFSSNFDWLVFSHLASFLLLVKCVSNRNKKYLVPLLHDIT